MEFDLMFGFFLEAPGASEAPGSPYIVGKSGRLAKVGFEPRSGPRQAEHGATRALIKQFQVRNNRNLREG